MSLFVTVDGQTVSGAGFGFGYYPPVITRVTGCVDLNSSGTVEECTAGTTVTIWGVPPAA